MFKSIKLFKKLKKNINVGIRTQNHILGLGFCPSTLNGLRRDKQLLGGPKLESYGQKTNGRRSEEELFLGCDECSSSMCSYSQRDLPRSSNDRDVPHEHTRRKETQKYLKESCYHRIKCTAAIFLAAFMWRRPLNSVALAITTHRKPKEVSDGIGT